MNLQPKSKDDFRTVNYWEEFFKKRKNPFEWYGDYAELGCILDKYMRPSDAILMPGCGSSKLSEDLYDNGYRDITNIDLSETVVRQVIARNSTKRPQMKTLKMDMTEMDFTEETFSVIVDKASLDAIFTDESREVLATVHKFFGEIDRILRPGGRFICISLAQKHICQKILSFFQEKWIVRIHCIRKDVSKDAGLGARLPVFVFVMTKMKIKLAQAMIEVVVSDETKPAKVTLDQAMSSILGMQEYSIVEHKLASTSLAEQVTIDLWSDSANQTSPRYSITIVDNPSNKSLQGQFGVFIVPQGRETEWLFSTEKGRQKLANAAGYKRLAVVALHRGHTYEDLDQVKADLSQHVMQLAPSGITSNHKAPFLTTSDNVGWREVIHEGSSSTGGGFAVEDVLTEDGQYLRRLILKGFASSIQSEARLVAPKSSKKKKTADIKLLSWKERKIDFNYLDPLYQAMLSALSFTDVSADNDRHILLIGLGGGSIARFLNRALPHCHLTCVELEGEIIESAKTWFALVESDHLRAVEDDGMAFMQSQVKEGVKHKYQSIIVDVNASDQGDGIIGPPPAFRDQEAVDVYSTLLRPNGALLMNFVTRSEEAMKKAVENLKDAFRTVYQCEIEEHVNRILVAVGPSRSNKQEVQISASSSALHDAFNRNLSGQLDFNVSELSARYHQL